jgi:two-component system response regulator PilR (NtrC family)
MAVLAADVGEENSPLSQSVLCVPLLWVGQLGTMIYLDAPTSSGGFNETHLQIASAIATLTSPLFCHLQQTEKLQRKNWELEKELLGERKLMGESAAFKNVMSLILKVARSASTDLILGESGTGKELVAKAIHLSSPRADDAFVSINCGAFPETLLESELFGYMKGAFTGAVANKKGLFEVADKGTIFLDEVGEMSPGMQVKLLRAIQERTIRRVGGTEELHVDVRIIAATNRDLTAMVAENQFREDLYYRISVIPLEIPPLRHRRDDIPLLANHFLSRLNVTMKREIERISEEALKRLETYDWPGNVRELENAMERAFILETSRELTAAFLPNGSSLAPGTIKVAADLPPEGIDLEAYVESIQRGFLEEALRRSNGVQVKAAQLLRMTYRSFRHYLQKYNIPA